MGRNLVEEEPDNSAESKRLNRLWETIRNCFNDTDEKGKKVEVKNQQGARQRFTEAC